MNSESPIAKGGKSPRTCQKRRCMRNRFTKTPFPCPLCIFSVFFAGEENHLCTRRSTRVFSKTELFDPGYIETVTHIRTYPELFENAWAPKRSFSKTLPKVDLSKTKVSDPDRSFLRVNMVSGSFLPLFPRRSKMACPSDEYCFTCICSIVAETGCNSFLFVSKGVAFENKTEDGCCCLQKQLYLVVFLDEGRLFCFCFILLRLLFVFHFAFGAFLLSPASMIRKLRTFLPRDTST